jgi:hypothetical protein
MDVSYTLKFEELHLRISEEKNQDIESRYNTLIEELYSKIQTLESKSKLEVRNHQEKVIELETKHLKQIELLDEEI